MGLLIMKVVIVGGGAGGISTASNIRKLDQNIEITVLTRDNKVAYSPCAIPYVLSGTIESFDDIIMRTPEDYKEKNIDVITEVEVTEVDRLHEARLLLLVVQFTTSAAPFFLISITSLDPMGKTASANSILKLHFESYCKL